MELILWVIVALLVGTSTVLVAKARQLEMVSIDSSERPAGRAHTTSAEYTQTRAWYRRQDTNRRSIWLKQW